MSLWGRLNTSLLRDQADLLQSGTGARVSHKAMLLEAQRLSARISAQTATETGPLLVALYLGRSLAFIISALACLRIGAAFLPLDPAEPPGRLRHLLQSFKPGLLLWAGSATTGGAGLPSLSSLGLEAPALFCLDDKTIPEQGSHGSAASAPAGYQGQGPTDIPQASRDAETGISYIMPTSGSTGAPLGACGSQQGILNRCDWMQTEYPLQPKDVVAFSTSPCFVDSIWQIFAPLLAGCSTLIIPQEEVSNPPALLATLACHKATHLVAVPSLLAAIHRHLTPSKASQLSLRLLVSSGEPLPEDLCRGLQDALGPGVTILNLYGSAEVAADCTCLDVSRHWLERSHMASPQGMLGQLANQPQVSRAVPAGHPISNTVVVVARLRAASFSQQRADANETVLEPGQYVRMRDGDPGVGRATLNGEAGSSGSGRRGEGLLEIAATGEVGEIVIAGDGLAAGYHRNEQATQCQYCQISPGLLMEQGQDRAVLWGSNMQQQARHASEDGTPLDTFWTGDLGRVGPHGLEIIGRMDHRIKLRGVSVDLQHIEDVLVAHPQVAAAAAAVIHMPAGSQIGAFVELLGVASDAALTPKLRDWCSNLLPSAAVPSQIRIMACLPRTAAGKLDRHGLAAWMQGLIGPLAANTPPPVSTSSSASMPILTVMRVLVNVLQQPKLEPTSDFFEWGGHSLAAAEAAAALGILPGLLSAYPTARKLARHLARAPASHQPPAVTDNFKEEHGTWAGDEPSRLVPCRAQNLLLQRGISSKGALEVLWRVPMRECVDASPLVWMETNFDCSQSGDRGLASGNTRWWTFACSHGGDVIAVDGPSGETVWETCVPGRAAAGLALSKDHQWLAVPCNDGRLFFLDAASGAVLHMLHAGGPVVAAPAIDPWEGHLWLGTHAKQVVLVMSLISPRSGSRPSASSLQFQIHTRHPVAAAVSTAVVFDKFRHQAYVTTLEGRLYAVQPRIRAQPWVDGEPQGTPDAWIDVGPVMRSAEGRPLKEKGPGTALVLAWEKAMPTPVLSTPGVDETSGLVVVALLDGSIWALSHGGDVAWTVRLDAPTFAPIAIHTTPMGLPHGEGRMARVAIICPQHGCVTALNIHGGALLAKAQHTGHHTAACGLLSPLPGDTLMRCVACLSGGSVVLHDLIAPGTPQPPTAALQQDGQPCPTFTLPDEVFSTPVIMGNVMLLGCRDDHLYCLRILLE
ncbi:hypothetical protein WJX84_006241 [Apatococcus fuscideae]|uniref:Carrier domain-containing protein n=1 Tax=Apatococcus fuscideae TaxID=2026836 RepID=A0AAW1T0F7_9CHLO